MDRENYKDNISVSIVTNAPQLTLQDAPTNTKVSIWGYELCNGAQWKDFLEVVNKLGKENEQLKQQLDEKDKEIEKLKQQYTILENENGKLTTELIMDKYKKAQKEVSFGKQLAIQELEKVKSSLFSKAIQITGTGVDCVRLYVIDKTIDQQIKELKGE